MAAIYLACGGGQTEPSVRPSISPSTTALPISPSAAVPKAVEGAYERLILDGNDLSGRTETTEATVAATTPDKSICNSDAPMVIVYRDQPAPYYGYGAI